jgi:RNA ligase (TIGR02306 family)
MSEFQIKVVRLGPFHPHPNADSLDIVSVYDYPLVSRRGNFKEGDLAVYLPLEAIVPDTEAWHFLAPKNPDGTVRFPVGQVPEKYRIIEAKKIRGIFSQGMLAPLPPGDWKEGDDVQAAMGITRDEPDTHEKRMSTFAECESPPKGWVIPVYTELLALKREKHLLLDGEEVVISEKIHGANARYVHDGQRLWAASRVQVKKPDPAIMWWQAAAMERLEEKLAKVPMFVFYGEVFGQVQDLTYGITSGSRFRAFDVWSVEQGLYLDHDEAKKLAADIDIPWVPELYRGPWQPDIGKTLCEGQSTLAPHVREGIVVKPVRERKDPHLGRVILKRHGEGYLLRKKKS